MPRHRMLAPKSLPTPSLSPSTPFQWGSSLATVLATPESLSHSIPAAIRMPFVSRSIVVLNNCPSVLLATLMPEGGPIQAPGQFVYRLQQDFRFAGNVGKIGLRCAAESAPYLSFAEGMEILVDAVGISSTLRITQGRCPNPAVEKEDSSVRITLFHSSLVQRSRA